MIKKSVLSRVTLNTRIVSIIIVFIFCLSLRLININEIGRTWDEHFYVEQGYKMTELFYKGDFNNSYFYLTYDHPPLVKYLYGITAHWDVAKEQGGNAVLYYDLTYSRVLSSIVFSLGVIILILFGWRFISFTVGIISGIILTLLPFTVGLSQLVTTESFKIFIYPLAIASFIWLIQKYSFKKIIVAGIITGVALQIKQSNALLIPLFVLMSLSYYLQVDNKEKKVFIKRTGYSLFWIILFSIGTFVALWPQMPFHLKEIYEIHRGLWHVEFTTKIWLFTVSVPEIFMGRLMLTPTFYYVVYFFISIPLFILLLFFVGIKKIFDKRNWILFSLILWFLVPFIMSLYSWRQHGLRYIIEIYPAIALIAALGFDTIISRFIKKEFKKVLFFIPVVVYLLFILWQIKPYYLDYFNEIVGGTNNVYEKRLFQQGWWGQGLREAGLYIKNNAPTGSRIGLSISPPHVFPYFESLQYEEWSRDRQYDYVVVNYYNIIREGFDDSFIKKEYILVKEVKVDKSTLVFIYKRK